MPYNFVADGFQTRNFVADVLRQKCAIRRKTVHFAFLNLLWSRRGLKDNVRWSYLRLIGKHIVNFLSMLIELFH